MKGSTVVVIGGTSGIGLETARMARAADADVVVTGRDRARLEAVRDELGAVAEPLDLADTEAVARFFAGLPTPVDHVLVSGGGPFYAPIADMDFEQARAFLDQHILGYLRIVKLCAAAVRPGGSLTFISGTGARHAAVGISLAAIGTAAIGAIVANAALEIGPVRVNAVAAGFVDTPLSARILGADLEARRQDLRDTLPIHRVVTASDVADLVLHLMTNTALTGAVYDVDGGQQLVH
ncbi:SDR family oxidoreductase [Actinoplanes sp. TRM 88003]|uniref:SDR family oxidoreductase n=1 Tax=Paractinoplanes aksuensis TaxID=2939490 RepID=A0ABT1E1M7_9ACTN|nr:SDR family oxidoreductase [Actinoplanes aksuensis]MCO8277029.1 SDR family oxidoreductase [Actinoplanes aksuensis]